jgi:CTP:phosphocholine cytidylyltransferase-like protein
MDIRHIKDCFFTLSGYMSNTFNFIKKKYKILLIVFCVYAVSNSNLYFVCSKFSRFFQISLCMFETVVTVRINLRRTKPGLFVFFFFLHPL